MNNSNNWKNQRNGKPASGGRGGRRNGKASRRKQNKSESGRRHFPKFPDTDHNNWPKNDWNCVNRNNIYPENETGIFPWIRKRPANRLIPQYINFEKQNDKYEEGSQINNDVKVEKEPQSVKNPVSSSVSNTASTVNSVTETTKSSNNSLVGKNTADVNQEKHLDIILKQEKTSSSSSSSSSEEEPECETDAVKPKATANRMPQSTSHDVTLKSSENTVNLTQLETTQTLKAVTKTSSKHASSSDEDSRLPSKPTIKANKKEILQVLKKELKTKKKHSEDDVVCIGDLENKIVLEDESESENSNEEESVEKPSNRKSKMSLRNISVMCMICYKKGHTSFQCQMICKNCSAPYHGYRTCPQPANLNTMLQLFFEFCMQQFQNFNTQKRNTSSCYNVPKPQVSSPHSESVSNKNKLKRKQTKAKTKASKKRKLSATKKKKSKTDSYDSSDGNDEDDTDSETTLRESGDDTADSTAGHNLANFSTNPINFPMVLNSFPSLPFASVQNPNALNTLLLTQMFQNSIDL